MTTHAHFAGQYGHAQRLHKSAEAVRATHAKIGVAAARLERARTAHAEARTVAAKTAKVAKTRAVEMQHSPTTESVRAADTARHRAMVARANLHTQASEVARHEAAHAVAVTRHAAAVALHGEAQRAAGFTPRETKAKLVGVASPEYHFADVMGRIRGAEPEHVAAPVREHVPVFEQRTRDRLASLMQEHAQEMERRVRAPRPIETPRSTRVDRHTLEADARWRARWSSSLEGVRGVEAVALPRMTVRKKGILRRWLSS